MKRLLLLSLALAFAACDNTTEADLVTPAPGFEASVTGAFSASLSGDAGTRDIEGTGIAVPIAEGDAGQSLTVLQLVDGDTEDAFVLIGLTESDLAPGTYNVDTISGDGLADEFLIAYRYPVAGGTFKTEAVAFAETGSLTVTRADGDVIAGSFAFEGRALARDGSRQAGEISVEATFTAEVREIERGGTR